MNRETGVKGKVINGQSREIVANVLKFMKQEAENGSVTLPLINYRTRVLAATKISKNTYQSILNESKKVQSGESASFSTPRKQRIRKSPKSTICVRDREVIRNLIQDFFIIEKRKPTLKGIYKKVMESALGFTGCLSTLRKIIRNMGFKWVKTADNRETLIESCDIRFKRITYLEQLKKYETEGRPIIFTDESYIHSTHSTAKVWSDGKMPGKKKPCSKGKRLIMIHAGGKDGFIPNGLLMFNSGTKSGDYHDDMNAQNFFRWIKSKLLPNLPPRSVLVLDDAPYHNVTSEKHPTSESLKADIVRWLAERNIPHDPAKTKPQLYEIVKQHKPPYRRYELDALLCDHGHSVLRLPPYHPELNPIEHIWALIKNSVAARNVNFNLEDVKTLALEKINSIQAKEWSAVCAHVDKTVHNYMAKEHLLDEALDNIQFLGNTSDTDNEESEDECEFSEMEEDAIIGMDLMDE